MTTTIRRLLGTMLLLSGLAALSSCTKEIPKPPLHITVSTYEVNFTKEASFQNIDFCFIGDWTTSSTQDSWIETKVFTNSDDSQMEKLNISVTENTTGAPRKGKVVVSTIREGKQSGSIADRIDRVVTVYQAAE